MSQNKQTDFGEPDLNPESDAAPVTGFTELSSPSKGPSAQRSEAAQAIGDNSAMAQSTFQDTSSAQAETPPLNIPGQGPSIQLLQAVQAIAHNGDMAQSAFQETSPAQVQAPFATSSELTSPQSPQTDGAKIALANLFDGLAPVADSSERGANTKLTSLFDDGAPFAGSLELSLPQSIQSEQKDTNLAPVSYESHGITYTPQTLYEQLAEPVKDKVREYCEHFGLTAKVHKDERTILTAEFTLSIPRPATESRSSMPTSFDRSKMITVQQSVYIREKLTANRDPVARDQDEWALINLVLPGLQPLRNKKSEASGMEWKLLDELVHIPEEDDYPQQNIACRIFHDQRRHALLQNYEKVADVSPGTHLAFYAEFGLYAFEIGRPMRIWTVGGHGSVEHGFDKDAKSPLGGCMYTYEEADVLCLTQEEHAIWAAHGNPPHNVLLIDAEFNRRRPAQSTKEFLEFWERMAHVEDILIDVQKTELSTNGYATVQMNLKDALRERKMMRKNQPVSARDPPRNWLNITDLTPGHLPEGLAKHYKLMNQIITLIDTKRYFDGKDMEGNSAIGKPMETIKHYSDMSACGQFRIYADRGAVSVWHQDQCGVVTWTLLEGNTDDPNERAEDVVKYWPSIDMKHLTEKERMAYLEKYSQYGQNWRPRPASGVPMISILKGQMLIQAPGNIHAPITLTDCGFIGGMVWKEKDVKDHIDAFRFTAENDKCTNEDVPRQAQQYVTILSKMIHNDKTIYGFAADDDLKEFDEACDVIYSKATECYCGDGCVRNPKCPCKIKNLKCGKYCHENKVFKREKPCSRWATQPIGLAQVQNSTEAVQAEKVVAAPKQRHVQNRGKLASGGKRRIDGSDEDEQAYQPDAKRQRRATSEESLPQGVPKRLSKRKEERAGKPCTNCERSGMRTSDLGPTGATLCSTCNKKWAAASKPKVWGSMKTPSDFDSQGRALSVASDAPATKELESEAQASREAPEAPRATTTGQSVPTSKRTLMQLFSDDESEGKIRAPKRQKTTDSRARGDAPGASKVPKATRPPPAVQPAKRKRNAVELEDESEGDIPIPTAIKRHDTMGAKAGGKSSAAGEVQRTKTMPSTSGHQSPGLRASGGMLPHSSTGNFFKSGASTAPNPFRPAGYSSSRGAVASPVAAAYDAAPVVAPGVAGPSMGLVTGSGNSKPSSSTQKSSATPAAGSKLSGDTLDTGRRKPTPAPQAPKVFNRRNNKMTARDPCFQCGATEAPEWKRKKFMEVDTSKSVCINCYYAPVADSARRPSAPADMAASLAPAVDTSRRSSADGSLSAPNTSTSSSRRSSVDLTAADSIATSVSVETRAHSSSITLGPVEDPNELAASAGDASIKVAPLAVDAPAEQSAPPVQDAPLEPALAVEQSVAPVQVEAPVEKKIKIRLNLGGKGKAPAEPAPVAASAPLAPKAKAPAAAAKKTSAPRSKKAPAPAAPKAKAPAKVKKEGAAVEAPAKRARRGDPEAKLVQIDIWAVRGKDAVNAAPKGKNVTDTIVKAGKTVGVETAGSESELSMHGDEEFEGF